MLTNLLQDRVHFNTILPLSWEVAAPVSAFAAEERQQSNIALLRALSTLESATSDKESEFGSAAQKTLERLEAKTDMALTLLAGLLANREPLPPAQPISVSAQGMAWLGPTGPEPGATLLLSIYLSPRFPLPLRLTATVITSEPQAEERLTRASFTDLTPEMLDWLERTVFRYHRRAIQARQGG
jgi:hypothetical protein